MSLHLVPRLRGVFHQYAFFAAVAAGTTLGVLADGVVERVAVWVYAVALAAMFGASALYHRVRWRTAAARLRARRLDHAMIFVFIAGTYTPFALLAMPERTGRAVLAVVWFGALGGVLLKTSWITAPRWLSVPLYLGLGWVAVFVLPSLLQHGGVAAFVLIIAGGLIYTVGGIVYGLKRPDPWPRTFGYHEVFHLCTVVAATCHMVAVWLAVY